MLEGLAQDYQLTLPAILRRAEQLYGYREIVTRRPDKSFHRHTFADFVSRSKKLAVALKKLGLEDGDRVGTLGWNTYQHLEAYFGAPCSGAVLHTLNPRLHEDDLSFIANHAEDRVMLVDETLVPVFQKFRERTNVEHAVVVTEGGDVPDGMISTRTSSPTPTRRTSSTGTSTRSRRPRCATPPARRAGRRAPSTPTAPRSSTP
jgi:fatty-acyl-CoA synthase